MKLVKVNFYNSMIIGLVNIFLINRIEFLGASLTTVLIYILSSIISNLYFIKLVK